MSKSVFAITTTAEQTQAVINDLISAGFNASEISVIAPDNEADHALGAVKETKAPEGATTGATTGGVVGGVLGLLAGIGALAIPGVGPLIAAGPILAALSGLGIGAAAGGLVGGLIGLGIPEYEAKVYDDKVKAGNFLLSVQTDDGDQVDTAKKILKDNHASDISVTSSKE